jgi:hypothetical protein
MSALAAVLSDGAAGGDCRHETQQNGQNEEH